MTFQVWTTGTQSERDCMHQTAAFRYWQEALDYKEYAIRRGVSCVIRHRKWRDTDPYTFHIFEVKQ